jgi:hypothetical protein
MSNPATPSRVTYWLSQRKAALSGALYGAALGLAIWVVAAPADPRSIARRLASGVVAYCEASDGDRAAIDRRLLTRLPAGVELQIRCPK